MLLRLFSAIFTGPPGCGLRGRLRVLTAMARLSFRMWRNGARLRPLLRFLKTRHYRSQLMLANYRGLVFLTSMPYTYGQNPWVIEIEDPTTLFYPLIQNGNTSLLQIAETPYFPIIKTLLESDQCKGILTHMKSTARLVPTLFGSEVIRNKVFYTPLGVKLPRRWQRHEESDEIHLVFVNSWCQVPGNLYVRGGLDVLEAFAILHERYPQLRLTLRTQLPAVEAHYRRILEKSWVRVIDRIMSAEEMANLLAESHIFLLPSARVHIVSLLQAMSHGLAVVTSDGWGIDEYITHERNGLIVKGRYGKVSWVDEKAGMLREHYEPMYNPNADVVDGIVEAVSRLVEDRALRKRLGQTARRDVQTNYTLERWNQSLKEVFDRALGVGPVKPVDVPVPQDCAVA
jgi:glycosyltransferase involved in cell wall biosynthesis